MALTSQEIAAHTEQFLAAGGSIEVLNTDFRIGMEKNALSRALDLDELECNYVDDMEKIDKILLETDINLEYNYRHQREQA